MISKKKDTTTDNNIGMTFFPQTARTKLKRKEKGHRKKKKKKLLTP
jgi:hypothetical protein